MKQYFKTHSPFLLSTDLEKINKKFRSYRDRLDKTKFGFDRYTVPLNVLSDVTF